jgi:hypothetical protein
MKHRLKKLLEPSSVLGFALCTAGTILGITYGLNHLHFKLSREYNVPIEEWGRFQGDVWAMMPDVLFTTLAFYALAVVLAPDSGDRAAIRRIARRKLSQPLISQDELEMWSRVMEEAKHDD